MQFFPWDKLFSFLLGSTFLGILIRFILTKTLDNLDKVVEKVNSIDTRLAAIDIHVQELGKMREMLGLHDRKIIELEIEIRKRNNGSSQRYAQSRIDFPDQD